MKLRFHARGTALVQDFDRLDAGIKSFLGRKYKEVSPGEWGFAPTGEAAEVEYRAEYVKACKDGDLHAADKATADFCGVHFDPHFGEEPSSEVHDEAHVDDFEDKHS